MLLRRKPSPGYLVSLVLCCVVLFNMVRAKKQLERHHHTYYGDATDGSGYDSELDGSYVPGEDASNSSSDISNYRSSESDQPNEPLLSEGWQHVTAIDDVLDTHGQPDIPFTVRSPRTQK